MPNLLKSIGLVTAGGLASYSLTSNLVGSDGKQVARGWLLKPKEQPRAELKETRDEIKSKDSCLVGSEKIDQAIATCKKNLDLWRSVGSIPGYTIGVSVRGRSVWVDGDGYADLENGVPCTGSTVMRIASISKSITAALLAKLIQEKKIDLDKPICEYLTPEQWPDKFWEGEKVDITLRQLVSHLGGIRHYKKEKEKDKADEGDAAMKEFYLTKHYQTVTESLSLFKDDPLVSRPGTKFTYTTFGWTLISAVMETQLPTKNFAKDLIKFLHHELGLTRTYLDQNQPIIPERARFYKRDPKSTRLVNSPYVDNSCKWAGGGLLSNARDLLRFGNMMLYSFKGGDSSSGRPSYLNQAVVDQMWTPTAGTKLDWDPPFGGYGVGWGVVRDERIKSAFTSEPEHSTMISHTGGAIGATSVLLIEPESEVVVSLITNLQNASGIYKMAIKVASQFATAAGEINEEN